MGQGKKILTYLLRLYTIATPWTFPAELGKCFPSSAGKALEIAIESKYIIMDLFKMKNKH